MKRFKRIYIEITNVCNLNCDFCPTSLKDKKEMDYNTFKLIIKKIKPYTDFIYLHVKGEPLLHSDLNKILKLCEKEKIRVNIVTNGRLIEKNKDVLLNSKAIRQISISLHSFTINNKDKINYYITNIVNFTNQILENNVIVSYRFWNLKSRTKNINNIIINMIKEKLNLDKKIHSEILNQNSVKIKKNFYLNKETIFEWPSLSANKRREKGFCYGLRNQIGILSDGTVVPCCLDSDGIINLGNIIKEEFNDILNKPRTKKIIEGFSNNKAVEELCKKCSYKERFNI